MRRMYSLEQLRTLIASSSDEIKEALKAQTLEVEKLLVKSPYSEYEVVVGDLSGRTFTDRYTKCFLNEATLTIVLNFLIENETEETIATSDISFEIEVDNIVGDNIVCFNGEKLSDNFTEAQQVASFVMTSGSYLSSISARAIYKTGKNKIKIYVNCPQLTASASLQFSGRQSLYLF